MAAVLKMKEEAWVPNKGMKKIMAQLGEYDMYYSGYVWRDGVVLVEQRRIKIADGVETSVWVHHAQPGNIQIRHYDYGERRRGSTIDHVQRIYVQMAAMLVNGLVRVDVAFGNTSEKLKEQGLSRTSITWRAPGGMIWRTDYLPGVDSSVAEPQPNPDYIPSWYRQPEESLQLFCSAIKNNGGMVVWYT